MNTFACMTSYFQAFQVITITFNTTLAFNMKSKMHTIVNNSIIRMGWVSL